MENNYNYKGYEFSDYENKGREKYERNATIPFEFTDNPYAKWDVSSTGESHTFNIELKDRDINYEKYASDGYMLEKVKYDALLEQYELTGSIPIYLNFFRDGIGYYWNLLNITPVWEWKYCTEKTANGEYGKKKVRKLVTMVYPDKGTKFNYK